jgi:hypothetical protein
MHQDGQKGEESMQVVKSLGHTFPLQFSSLELRALFASAALGVLASLGIMTAS